MNEPAPETPGSDSGPGSGSGLAVAVTASDTHRAIDAVWRIESARLIAGLARIVRDVGLAEELAQDALVAALEQWPESGVPDNPGAWLMATAKHRAIDRLRRSKRLERKHEELGRELEARQETAAAGSRRRARRRRRRRPPAPHLHACHPVLSTEARVALTLRLLGGLTTEEIARAFLVPEPTVAQRIVRAKRTLAEARVPFEVPRGAELAARLSSVLEVIYLVFNEGYSATAGDDWMRPGALRGRAPPRPHPGRARSAGAGGPRPRRADGDPGVALAGAGRPVGRAHPAARSEPRALGSAPHPPRARGARARRGARRRARPVRAAGRDRRLSRAGAHRRRRPTGRASRRSTTRSPSSRPRPSWS